MGIVDQVESSGCFFRSSKGLWLFNASKSEDLFEAWDLRVISLELDRRNSLEDIERSKTSTLIDNC